MAEVKAERVIEVDALRHIDPELSYVVTAQFPKHYKREEREVELNKIEFAFKSLGVKKVRAIEHVHTVFKVE